MNKNKINKTITTRGGGNIFIPKKIIANEYPNSSNETDNNNLIDITEYYFYNGNPEFNNNNKNFYSNIKFKLKDLSDDEFINIARKIDNAENVYLNDIYDFNINELIKVINEAYNYNTIVESKYFTIYVKIDNVQYKPDIIYDDKQIKFYQKSNQVKIVYDDSSRGLIFYPLQYSGSTTYGFGYDKNNNRIVDNGYNLSENIEEILKLPLQKIDSAE